MTAGASESWDRYLAELEGLIGLADERVRRGAAAEAALQEESRRLQLQMSSAERDLTGLEARNGRLQIAVRELARTAGVSAAPTSVPQEDALEFTDVPGEMKALEYDVDQLRRSLASVSASSASTVKLVDSNPAPPPPPPPIAAVSERTSTSPRFGGPVVIAVAVLVILGALLALVVPW